jgi:hypothetical protein
MYPFAAPSFCYIVLLLHRLQTVVVQSIPAGHIYPYLRSVSMDRQEQAGHGDSAATTPTRHCTRLAVRTGVKHRLAQ